MNLQILNRIKLFVVDDDNKINLPDFKFKVISYTFENRKFLNKLFYKSILINIFTKIGRENVFLICIKY